MFIVKKGEGSLWSRPAKQALSRVLSRYDGTPFELRFWDGGRLRFGAGASEFSVTFRTRRALFETLVFGSLGLAEAHVRHEVMFEGELEDVLTGLGQLTLRLPRSGLLRQREGLLGALGAMVHDATSGSAWGEKDAIERHYGLGDDFYRLYMDRRLQHSCGYFRAPGEALDEAQAQKIRLAARKLALRRGQRLLDIGCGWGHFMLHAAEHHGVECLGITLCDNQARYIRERAEARRLPVEVRVMRFEDLDDEVRWDRVVSFGAMCHVGERRLDRFFDKVKAVLAPGGICLLQSIARMRESSDTDPFVQKHVFPGYFIPSLAGMTARAAARGLDVLDAENLRRHGALTARGWRRNFLESYERIQRVTGFDDAFMRRWDFFLAYAAAAFRTGHLGIIEMVMANGVQDDYPLARDLLFAVDEAPPPWEGVQVGPSAQGSRHSAAAPS
jgi:cyclopropane-fatty-acyl-phospholipid synthase